MRNRIAVCVMSDDGTAEITLDYDKEDGMWRGGQMQLHDALDAIYGPALVADAIAEGQTGQTF